VSDDGYGVHFAPNGELARPKDDGDGPAIHTTSIIVREAASPVNSFSPPLSSPCRS
jgi:hypothetical protein